jgi:hypothetical protein
LILTGQVSTKPWADPQYNYAAPAFDFTSQLVYDEYGLVVRYPGIAVRAA